MLPRITCLSSGFFNRLLEPVIKPMVKRKIEKVIQENDLPSEAYELMVYKSVLRSCVELEYSDVIRPGFFASVAYWYAKGHFPCGWKDVKVKGDYIDFYPPGFYDAIAKWYEAGDFGNWQGQIPPPGKLIVY